MARVLQDLRLFICSDVSPNFAFRRGAVSIEMQSRKVMNNGSVIIVSLVQDRTIGRMVEHFEESRTSLLRGDDPLPRFHSEYSALESRRYINARL